MNSNHIPAVPRVPSGNPFRAILLAYLAFGVPGILALAAYRQILENLGTERFGALSVLLTIAVFFNAFDLGVSAAVARFTAKIAGRSNGLTRTGHLFHVAAILQFAFGALIAICLMAAQMTFGLWAVANDLELTVALLLLALSIPAALFSSAIKSGLEGMHEFNKANALRFFSSISAIIMPVAFTFFTNDLRIITGSVLFSRIAVAVYALYSWRRLIPMQPPISRRHRLKIGRIILAYGGWVTVGTAFGGLITLGVIDRVMIGRLLTPEQVVLYSVPSDIIVRLLLIPAAISSVLIPVLTRHLFSNAAGRPSVLSRAVYLMAAHTGATTVILAMNSEALLFALTGASSRESLAIFLGLIIGFYIHSIAHVFFCVLHARGRPDLSSFRHVIELPIYVAVCAALYTDGKIHLAGAAWAAWAFFDLLLLLYLVERIEGRMSSVSYLASPNCVMWLALTLASAWLAYEGASSLVTAIITTLCTAYLGQQILLLVRAKQTVA